MKIFLCIFSRNDAILNISETLYNMGYEVHVFPTDSYRLKCSYIGKKLDKLGFHGKRKKYESQWKSNFIHALKDNRPSKCIFINTLNGLLSADDMQDIKEACRDSGTKTVGWLVDPVGYRQDIMNHCRFFDKLYVYEYKDVAALKAQGITAEYLPVGYQPAYESISSFNDEKVWDICFVGSPYKNRLNILEQVAQKARQCGWSFLIAGPFWPRRHIWKKYIFALKYPNIFHYVCNGAMSSNEVASLYKQSKICLNIHVGEAASCNPRTFEIMATGSFEILDSRGYYDELLPGEDLVVYKTADELIELIGYYLRNQNEREHIANSGHCHVKRNYSMDMLLKKIIEND